MFTNPGPVMFRELVSNSLSPGCAAYKSPILMENLTYSNPHITLPPCRVSRLSTCALFLPNSGGNSKSYLNVQGGAAFGASITSISECQECVDVFASHGHIEYDTSNRYGQGKSEQVLLFLLFYFEKAAKAVSCSFPQPDICSA